MAGTGGSKNRIDPALKQGDAFSPQRCGHLLPHELSRHYFHSVRQGNVEYARQLLRLKPSLLNELDESLLGGLHHAVKLDQLPMLQFLLRSGANANLRGREGLRPLHVAVLLPTTVALLELLRSRRVKVDATDDMGQTALHLACRRNRSEAVRILAEHKATLHLHRIDSTSILQQPASKNNLELCQILASGSDLVNIGDKHGVTPVMMAASAGSGELLEYFVKIYTQSGATPQSLVNATDKEGNSPLHFAAKNNKAAMVAPLHKHGAKVDSPNADGATAMHLAATLGYQEVVEQLLQFNASLLAADRRGRTALHRALIAKQEKLALLLLAKSASPSAQDEDLLTPLSWASRRGLATVAGQLLELAPDTWTMPDIDMRTSLHWAILIGCEPIVNQLLAKPQCESIVNAADCRDKTPLHYAVERNDEKLVKALAAKGGNLHSVDSGGRTPAQVAVRLGHQQLVRTIASIGAEEKRDVLRHRDATGMTSLLIAAEEGHESIFAFLVGEGADFTEKDDYGKTALMIASGSGHSGIVAALIERGVDVNVSDINRNTALHFACKHKSDACLSLLLENGASLQENYNLETPVDVAVLSSNEVALEVLFSDEYCDWVVNFRRESGHTHMDMLIEHSPQTVEKLLNRSITESSADHLDKNFMVAYNFFLVDPGPDDPASMSTRYLALRTMVDYKREQLLMHPLCRALLEYKWSVARYFFFGDLLFYLLFLACITAFIAINGPLPESQIDSSTGCKNQTVSGSVTGEQQKLTDTSLIIQKYFVIVFLCIRILLEVFKLLFKRLHYLKNYENPFFLVLYGISFVFMWPPDSEPCRFNWIFGLFAITMAWCLLIFQFEHLPVGGLYSIMFQKVIVSVVKVLLIFLFVIIGFSMSFYIGLISNAPFNTVTLSMLKTLDMTIGEIDYVSYFIDNTSQPQTQALLAVFVIFVIVVPISLMNLLVGIAVGDISGISREASLKLLEIRVSVVYELETNLPKYFQRLVHRKHKQVYPNKRRNVVSESVWPYGRHYRQWRQRCANDQAETTAEERLVSVEEQVRQIAAKLEAVHRAVVR